MKLLLEPGADPDTGVTSHEFSHPLHRAVEHRGVVRNSGPREVVELFIRAGASPETRSTWTQLPPLAVVGLAGDREMIAFLLEVGAPTDLSTTAATSNEAGVRSELVRDPPVAAHPGTEPPIPPARSRKM